MKFLCVACDEAMSLVETRGPDRGSMTVVFGCPSCGRQTAMLTNAMETQVVRSLGVKIGGRTAEAEPLEGLAGLATGSPFPDHGHGAVGTPEGDGGSSKCPFTGMVEDAYEASEIVWTEPAMKRAEKIPVFARRMAMKGVEDYARENGYKEISETVLDEARGHMGL